MAGLYRVSRLTVNGVTFTALNAPEGMNWFGFQNIDGKDMLARTDVNDANTEWPIAGNIQEGVIVPMPASVFTRYRWAGGETICFLKQATAGTSVVVLKVL